MKKEMALVKMLLLITLKQRREEFNTKTTSRAHFFYCIDFVLNMIFSVTSAVLWWREKCNYLD